MAYPTDHLTKSDVPFAEDGRRHGDARFGLMLVSTPLPEARYGSIVEVFSGHILDAAVDLACGSGGGQRQGKLAGEFERQANPFRLPPFTAITTGQIKSRNSIFSLAFSLLVG